uniref:Reverse transcriptase Ty1/copia-type domain-containing protein n=1 Tax=Lactuca sativa TaxID=4236 RepID=A0A9R1V2K6_LACSA|nr:hypothetical protein LSAT_V11C700350240 [Lactuca sativa]
MLLVFHIKYKSDGFVEQLKYRLVAQGLHYSHCSLSLYVLHKWFLHQLDVKYAFLHGHLNEIIFMEQPHGFVDPQLPNNFCKLSKALYGLNQAPRAWFHHLSMFLLSNGFVCSCTHPSLFIYAQNSSIMYLLMYMYDLILTGNNKSVMLAFTNHLNHRFEIKNLEVSYTDDGLFLSQSKHATDIIHTHNPCLFHLELMTPSPNQNLHFPNDDNFQPIKHNFCYVKGTISFGLTFHRLHTKNILGYSDGDWARCIET